MCTILKEQDRKVGALCSLSCLRMLTELNYLAFQITPANLALYCVVLLQSIQLFGEGQVDLPPSLHSILSGAHPSSRELSYQLKKNLGFKPGDLCVVATSGERERDKMVRFVYMHCSI